MNHDAGEYLARCLASVSTAAGTLEVELVVVDNASRDGSSARAAREHSSLRLLRNADNRGFAAAANQGIRATTADLVLLLNPDAEIVGGSLEALVKVAREHPAVGAVGALVRNTDGSVQPSARKVPTIAESIGHAFLGPFAPKNRYSRAYTMADWDRTSEREVEWVSGSAMLLRRQAFDAVGGFDEGYFMYVEDVDLCTRMRLAGWAVLFSPELEVVHASGISSRARSRHLAFEHGRSLYRYFVRHRARGWRAGLKPLVRAGTWLRAAIVSVKNRAR